MRPSKDVASGDSEACLRTATPRNRSRPLRLARPHRFDSSLDLVRGQIRSYANLYERTRQRMRASSGRTQRMERFSRRCAPSLQASYPLLDEPAGSPSPSERSAAVAILQAFAYRALDSVPYRAWSAQRSLLTRLSRGEGASLRCGRHGLDRVPATVERHTRSASCAKVPASVGFDSERQTGIHAAEEELRETITALAAPAEKHD